MATSQPNQPRRAVPIFPSCPTAALATTPSAPSTSAPSTSSDTRSAPSAPSTTSKKHSRRPAPASSPSAPSGAAPSTLSDASASVPTLSAATPSAPSTTSATPSTPVPATPAGRAPAPQAAPSESSANRSTTPSCDAALDEALATLRLVPDFAIMIAKGISQRWAGVEELNHEPPPPAAEPEAGDGHRFFGRLGLNFSGLDTEEPAPTNKPAFNKVCHFEIQELANTPDHLRPEKCVCLLVGVMLEGAKAYTFFLPPTKEG
ncbi:hypothetical protein JCM5296_006266 [Sporobolomyces johnsonii]